MDWTCLFESTSLVEIFKAKTANINPAIRLVTLPSGRTTFQIRGPLRKSNGSDGKDQIIAGAYLTRDQMRQLRNMLDEVLSEDEVCVREDEAGRFIEVEHHIYRSDKLPPLGTYVKVKIQEFDLQVSWNYNRYGWREAHQELRLRPSLDKANRKSRPL